MRKSEKVKLHQDMLRWYKRRINYFKSLQSSISWVTDDFCKADANRERQLDRSYRGSRRVMYHRALLMDAWW